VSDATRPQIRVALAAFRYGHQMAKLGVEAQLIDFSIYVASTVAARSGLDPFDRDWMHRSPVLLRRGDLRRRGLARARLYSSQRTAERVLALVGGVADSAVRRRADHA
jgi:hypothetical protein